MGLGPLRQALETDRYDLLVLLSDHARAESEAYLEWALAGRLTERHLSEAVLSSPTNFGEIFLAARAVLKEVVPSLPKEHELTFHLSPGTPAMAAIWLLLSKTIFPAKLLESSREHGVREVVVPFDIAAEFVADLGKRRDVELREFAASLPPDAPEFRDICQRSRVMKRTVARVRRIAGHDVPTLIEGESGTGKELLARAIHRASSRGAGPFIAVNCGAIPEGLVESELFGYKKGSHGHAYQDRRGYFSAANEGTLFLDEVGELPLGSQVKLLRVLQEGEVTPLGATRPQRIDVRIVAATNRSLVQEVRDGRFRADLFYRLAVAVLNLPPLRKREGDTGQLIDVFLAEANASLARRKGRQKNISAAARNLLLQHSWPGNVRELQNTIRRAHIWASSRTISAEDIRESLFPATRAGAHTFTEYDLDGETALPEFLDTISKRAIDEALSRTSGNKTQAASLLGMGSYQTLTNWMKRLGVESVGTGVANDDRRRLNE